MRNMPWLDLLICSLRVQWSCHSLIGLVTHSFIVTHPAAIPSGSHGEETLCLGTHKCGKAGSWSQNVCSLMRRRKQVHTERLYKTGYDKCKRRDERKCLEELCPRVRCYLTDFGQWESVWWRGKAQGHFGRVGVVNSVKQSGPMGGEQERRDCMFTCLVAWANDSTVLLVLLLTLCPWARHRWALGYFYETHLLWHRNSWTELQYISLKRKWQM